MNEPVIKLVTRKAKKKAKKPDNRPARKRYWLGRHLEQNKIRHLMKHCKMTKQQAEHFWYYGNKQGKSKRIGRVPENYIIRAKIAG